MEAAREDQCARRAVAGELDACDALVNNAGGALGADPIESSDPEHWRRRYEVNVIGVLNVTKAFLPLLRRSPRPTVVTITSTAGTVSYEGGAGYCAAKHAEHAVLQTLRLELCGEPIRVVEIAPGMVATEESAVNRLHGDVEAAAMVYADAGFVVGLPQYVNVDVLTVRPAAQAAQHKLHRGPLEPQG